MTSLDGNMDSAGIDDQDVAIWWIRRDLRLADNQALAAALSTAGQVVPLFILDPALLSSTYVGEKRLAFLFDGLRQLDADLRRRESRLVVRSGSAVDALTRLVHETSAGAIYAEADYSPYARRRDRLVSGQLPLELVGGLTVHSPRAVLKANGTPYTVFTPYRRRWSELSLPSTRAILPAPESISGPTDLESDPIPATRGLASTGSFIAGEHEAARRLQAFIDGEDSPVHHYGDLRDRLDVRGTSELSPYLRFGMLSARQVVVSALTAVEAAADEEAHASAQSWLEELIWREFYISILYHFPDVMRASFRRELQGIRWSNDRGAFQAWCEGRTGYPVVDAAMRQLSQRGWMPNRARMIVASFLVKDLLIDWRWGEQWFMQHLVDGDLAANNGGWQWTAGTGTDAAPYFRIFNPITQAKKHDPDGIYVRRWIPELARVPRERIHEPWKMDVEIQRGAGCLIGRDYPAPIVDHAWARDRVLGAYAAARLSDP